MLDPTAAEAVRDAVRRYVELTALTVVIVEHHLEPWIDFADRLLVLDHDGSILADGDPDTIIRQEAEYLISKGVWVPGRGLPDSVAVDPELLRPEVERHGWAVRAEGVSVSFRPGWHRRSRTVTPALADVSLTLTSGAATAPDGTERARASRR